MLRGEERLGEMSWGRDWYGGRWRIDYGGSLEVGMEVMKGMVREK